MHVLGWRLILDRFLTRVLLASKGIIPQNECCAFCLEQETSQDIFFCVVFPKKKKVCKNIMSWLNASVIEGNNVFDHLFRENKRFDMVSNNMVCDIREMQKNLKEKK